MAYYVSPLISPSSSHCHPELGTFNAQTTGKPLRSTLYTKIDQAKAMDLAVASDYLEKCKLDAEFLNDCTLQLYRTAANTPQVQQIWQRARPLGSGGLVKYGKKGQRASMANGSIEL